VEYELGFAFKAVNLKKYAAQNTNPTKDNGNNPNQNSSNHQKPMIGTILYFSASYVPTSFHY